MAKAQIDNGKKLKSKRGKEKIDLSISKVNVSVNSISFLWLIIVFFQVLKLNGKSFSISMETQ